MNSRLRLPFALLAILLAFPPAAAQYRYEGDPYEDDGIRQTVARVSYFEGAVSFNSSDAPDDWQPASINFPMTFGDRIWAGRNARVELQLRGATAYLAPESELAALDLTYDVRQLSLAVGTASFRVNRLERDEVFEVATPNVSVTFGTAGIYRVDVDEDGNSRVSVYQGRAWAAAAGGQVELERGDQVRVWGIDRPGYDVVRVARADGWDRWVETRARRLRSVRSASYVHPDIYGVDDLDAYGAWENVSEYGSVWFPRVTVAGWEPYRAGRWVWRDPWGWTWLSSEPWGWAPYHYGRWAVHRGRWCWVPVGPRGRYPGYSPAVVGFVGGGAGWSVSVSVGAGGFVGWFPIGPQEPFHPWWYRSRSRRPPSDYDYAYRRRSTIVSRDVFVRGGRVDRDLVRDARVAREISLAPVLSGPIPVLPTRESIRVGLVGVEGRGGVRPPEQVLRREVVTRSVPPPAPPSFDQKLDVIRQKGGEPVSVDVARRLTVEEGRGRKETQPVRPAARDEVLLAPRGQVKTTQQPQPLPSTGERPVSRREEIPPARAPEPGYKDEPARQPVEPRRYDTPAPRPPKERAPEPQPEWRQPAPPPPAQEARPERREAPPPTEPPFVRPDRFTKPKSAPTPAPESPRAESPKAESPKAEPEKAEPKKGEKEKGGPEKAEPKPTKPKQQRETAEQPKG